MAMGLVKGAVINGRFSTISHGNTNFYFNINEWVFEKLRGVLDVLL